MRHVIANSFGESSGLLDWTIRHEWGMKDAISIFQNTGWEHPATIQFGKDQQKHWGTQIIYLEYELPKNFTETVLKHAPTYENLEKYGFKGMYQLDVLDPIRWDRSEVKYQIPDTKQPILFDRQMDLTAFKADYRRCLNDFWKLLDKEPTLHRYQKVTADTCNMDGLPILKVLLYFNAIRYVKRLDWIVPSAAHRFCTGKLKVDVMRDFLKSELNVSTYTKYLGIRRDEVKRYYNNLSSSTSNIVVSMPLFELEIDALDVKFFWDKQPFQLQIRDKKYLGNCANCHLKTALKKIKACQEYPKPFRQQKIIEQAAGDMMKRAKGHSAREILFESMRRKIDNGELLNDVQQEIFCTC